MLFLSPTRDAQLQPLPLTRGAMSLMRTLALLESDAAAPLLEEKLALLESDAAAPFLEENPCAP